jgi:chaperonin cofactor prefoldin|tara:strand:- start:219 stop:404 length:186 start_codon:yes stop_codon:yes gene_type:complete
MKSLEYAQMHLVNVQQQIQQLTEQKAQIEQQISQMQQFLEKAIEDVKQDQAALTKEPELAL